MGWTAVSCSSTYKSKREREREKTRIKVKGQITNELRRYVAKGGDICPLSPGETCSVFPLQRLGSLVQSAKTHLQFTCSFLFYSCVTRNGW